LKILKNITGSSIFISDLGITIPTGGQIQIPLEEFGIYSDSINLLDFIRSGDIVVNNGVEDLDIIEGIRLIQALGRKVEFTETAIDANGRLKVAQAYDPHASTHQDGGTDKLNVENLTGVLADPQHPIEQECLDAMGVKNNTNPYHHDRFQQSEILNLSESQLSLNFPTHSNNNDPSTAQKLALDASLNPGSGNEYLTKSRGDALYSNISHSHTTLPTQSQKDALDNANSPSQINPFATLNDISESVLQIYSRFSSLPSSTGSGDIVKILEDETISSFTYQAGWYEDVGGTSGTNNTGWLFYSTYEDHVHTWDQVSKAGSELSDIEDVPAYPNDGNDNIIIENNGLLSFIQYKPKKYTYVQVHDQSGTINNGSWFFIYPTQVDAGGYSGYGGSNDFGFMIPFNCKINRIIARIRDADYNWLSSPGLLRFGFSIYDMEDNSSSEVAVLSVQSDNVYTGGSFSFEDLRIDQTPTTQTGSNSFQAGDILGIRFTGVASNPGDVYRMARCVFKLEFEEIT
jgi:hypothetical protein